MIIITKTYVNVKSLPEYIVLASTAVKVKPTPKHQYEDFSNK